MSSELLTRNKVNADADLLAAKEEAKEVIRSISDDELGMVTGGAGTIAKYCIYCCADNLDYKAGVYKCRSCGRSFSLVSGDGRDGMSEALADIDGLMSDIDGWD